MCQIPSSALWLPHGPTARSEPGAQEEGPTPRPLPKMGGGPQAWPIEPCLPTDITSHAPRALVRNPPGVSGTPRGWCRPRSRGRASTPRPLKASVAPPPLFGSKVYSIRNFIQETQFGKIDDFLDIFLRGGEQKR